MIVDFYREVGYLPDAILNYLVLLGWSLDDKTEEFSRDEMIRVFSLDRVNKAPASFDPKKLFAFQEHYMQRLPIEPKTAMCLPYLQKAGLVPDPAPADLRDKVTEIVRAANERIKVAGDVLDYRDFFVADEQSGLRRSGLREAAAEAAGGGRPAAGSSATGWRRRRRSTCGRWRR